MRLLLDWLYPSRCGICGWLGQEAICPDCQSEMLPAGRDEFLFAYGSLAGEAVRRLKYARVTSLGHVMSQMLHSHYTEHLEGYYDAIVPVPVHWSRRFMRGFNQAETLCESFAPSLVRQHWLRRTRATPRQVGLSRDQRLANVTGAFRASAAVTGKRLLLVDDVVTSGATFFACRDTLLASGAAEVHLLCFAGSAQFMATGDGDR